MKSLMRLIRNLRHDPEDLVERALEWRTQGVDRQAAVARLREALRATEKDPTLFVGTPADGPPLLVRQSYFDGRHVWAVGSTGSGKSSVVLAWILQLLRRPLIVADFSSELTHWCRRGSAATVARWAPQDREKFIDELLVVSPFGARLCELNLLHPIPGLPAPMQAREVAGVVADALGPGHSNFGPNMSVIIANALELAITLGLSLLEVREALRNGAYLNGLLRFCANEDLRSYFAYAYPKSSKDSIHAVMTRLDLLLYVPDLKRSLCAIDCIDFSKSVDRGTTFIELGNPPRGAPLRSLARVFLLGVMRSVHSRLIDVHSRPCTFVADEFVVGLDQEIAAGFSDVLARARKKRVGLWLLHQQGAQLAEFGPGLKAALKQNSGIQVVFRQNEDPGSFGHILPTGEQLYVPKGPSSPSYDLRRATPEEQRRLLLEELTRLPPRHFWFAAPDTGIEAVLLRSPTVDFEGMFRAADGAPQEIQDACDGFHGKSRGELDLVLERRWAHIKTVIGGRADRAAPSFGDGPVEVSSAKPAGVEQRPPEVRRAEGAGRGRGASGGRVAEGDVGGAGVQVVRPESVAAQDLGAAPAVRPAETSAVPTSPTDPPVVPASATAKGSPKDSTDCPAEAPRAKTQTVKAAKRPPTTSTAPPAPAPLAPRSRRGRPSPPGAGGDDPDGSGFLG
jgi:hypothetical protein